MSRVDFHVHSCFSDGVYSPEELVRMASGNGLAGFALTDHDTFDGVGFAKTAVKELSPELFFMPGCEFSTFHQDVGEVHVLGYFPNGGWDALEPLLEQMQVLRMERGRRIVELLNDRGLKIDFDELAASLRKSGAHHFPLGIGRMQIARKLVEMGYFNNTAEAFDRYLKAGRSCYVSRRLENSLRIVKMIRESGGLPVIAHPLFLEHNYAWKLLDGYLEAGCVGIECRHPKVSAGLSQKIVENCTGKFELFGGSDFHGDKTDNPLGTYGVEIEDARKVFDNFLKK